MKSFATPFLAALLSLTLSAAVLGAEEKPVQAKAESAKTEAKAEPAKAAKPDLAKGEASFGAVCAACHAADGNSGTPANPKLAQQHPEYIVKQLSEFKSGKRANPRHAKHRLVGLQQGRQARFCQGQGSRVDG